MREPRLDPPTAAHLPPVDATTSDLVERTITLGLMAALVGLTWRLVNATRQLAEESKHTRKESRLTRLQSGYIEGIAPFIGSYAEPGQLEYTRDHGPILRDDEKAGRYVQGEGGRLDVNWYGVTFWHPDIGYFVGGAVYIEEDALTWSMSAQTYGTDTEQKMSPAILELRNKVRDWESRSAISWGIETVNGRPVDEREL